MMKMREKYRKPNEEQLKEYSNALKRKIEEKDWTDTVSKFQIWSELINEAAEDTLTKMPPEQKQPYIGEETWNVLEEKWKANEDRDFEKVKTLDKTIRDRIRKEKQEYKLAQFLEIDEQGYKWDGRKSVKKKFSPTFCKFKDKTGKHIPYKQYAEKAAEYLKDVQWKKIENAPEDRKRKQAFPETKDKIKDEPFHIEELNFIVNK